MGKRSALFWSWVELANRLRAARIVSRRGSHARSWSESTGSTGILASFARRKRPIWALAAAHEADARGSRPGSTAALLHGVPLGVKDLFWTKGVPARCGHGGLTATSFPPRGFPPLSHD